MQAGLAGEALLAAVHAQAERLGTDLTCNWCDFSFLYRRLPVDDQPDEGDANRSDSGHSVAAPHRRGNASRKKGPPP